MNNPGRMNLPNTQSEEDSNMATNGLVNVTRACNKVEFHVIPFEGTGERYYLKSGSLRIYTPTGDIEDEHFVPVVFDAEDKIVGRLNGWMGERAWISDFTQAEMDALKSTGRGVAFNHL